MNTKMKKMSNRLDDGAALRINIYELNRKSTESNVKIANLVESQSYMAVEFDKMQSDIKRLKEEMEDLQRNVKYQTVENHYLLADVKSREEKNVNRIFWFAIAYAGGQLLGEIAKVILHTYGG